MYTRLLNRIRAQGAFFSNVLTVVSGALLARVIAVAVLPLLSRIYTPDDFGLLGLFTTINVILATVVCLGYEPAIVLPRQDRNGSALLLACLRIATVAGVLLLGVAFVFGSAISGLLNNPDIESWLPWCAFAVWCIGAHTALRYWAARHRRFGPVSQSMVGSTGVNALVQVGFGLTSVVSGGLIIGQIAGRIAATGILAGRLGAQLWAGLTDPREPGAVARVMGRYRRFPLFNTWASLLNVGSQRMPVLLLGIYFDPAIVGLYFIAEQLLAMPAQLVGQSIAQVFYPSARDARGTPRLAELVEQLFRRLLGMGLTPVLLLIPVAPEVTALVLGADWYDAGIYIAWLSVWFMVILFAVPITQLFDVLEKQRQRLVYQIMSFVAGIAALVVGGNSGDPVVAVALFGVSRALIVFGNAAYLMLSVGVRARNIVAMMAREVMLALPFAIAMAVIRYGTADGLWLLAGFTVLGLAFAGLRYRSLVARN